MYCNDNMFFGNVSSYSGALKRAVIAYEGKKDKQGMPYVIHLINVLENLLYVPIRLSPEEFLTASIVGVFHDIVEDGLSTFEKLSEEYSEDVIKSLRLVTRDSDKTYAEYIDAICDSSNAVAIAVKWADLQDNLSKCSGKAEFESLGERYKKALEKIEDAMYRIQEM